MTTRRRGWLVGLAACLGLLAPPRRAWAQRADASPEARVAAALCGKRVVVLGELPSHGEARAFQAKAAIVERLVDRCGFDALLFEAPIYDFLAFQDSAAVGRATPAQLDRAIGRFWWTRELADWRRWLFRRVTEGRLTVGGLDDQVSVTSDYARATLPTLVAATVPAARAAECGEAVARHLNWRYDAAHPFDEPERVRLQQCARLAADTAATRAARRGGPGTPDQVMLANLADYVDRQRDTLAAPDRDAAMYRNFRWLSARRPGPHKVIIWTATVHAARGQGALPHKPLGAWLAEQWGDRLAVVGFSAFAGQSSMAGHPARPLPDAPPGSLEALTTRADTSAAAPWVDLDAPALHKIGPVPSRLLGGFATADWSAYFDHVLVVRNEVAPTFEPWR